MRKFIIITDSCVDLPAKIAEEFELVVIPLNLLVNNKVYNNYLDEREISFKEFYDLLRSNVIPQTSQINPSKFLEIFTPYLENDYDILSISFSSALSGTYQSSVIAKDELILKYPNRNIITIDSKCASMGQGLLLTYAANLKKNGHSLSEVAKWVEDNKTNICHLFTVGDLNHLRRGGRLSYAKALLGTILKIKPLLHVNIEGKLVQTSSTRGRKQALNLMVERMKNTIINPQEQTIYISHGDCEGEVIELVKIIKDEIGVKNIIYNYVGPVIGSHSGLNTVAIFYLGNDRVTPY